MPMWVQYAILGIKYYPEVKKIVKEAVPVVKKAVRNYGGDREKRYNYIVKKLPTLDKMVNDLVDKYN
jgi:hypothetical protein